MDPNNPYASPSDSAPSYAPPSVNVHIRRRTAIVVLAVSTVASAAFCFIDLTVFRARFEAWPLVITTSVISTFTGWLTRDPVFAPLCCFIPVLTLSVVAGLVRDWDYAQMDVCFGVALGFSIPSLLTAIIARKRAARQIDGQ